MSPAFLLFSGHNDRAVVALCRYFSAAGLDFVIASAGQGDAIHKTAYANRVVFERIDRVVSVSLLAELARSAGRPLVYCPTTEFINDFVLRHRAELETAGLRIGLPPREVYEALTGKLSSQRLMAQVPGLRMPMSMPVSEARAPCVLKPKLNTDGKRVLYPLLCRTAEVLDDALGTIDPALWFAQEWVSGQSHYWCAYLARDGRVAGFWQQNLMQQPGGKSIVLARVCRNPGLDEAALVTQLRAAGYHGPLMIEVIANERGLHYIEINPRFWGPLQLALDACPELLHLYAEDEGIAPAVRLAQREGAALYAWHHGACQPGVVVHPAAASLADREALLREHDVYARPDTEALHGRF
jgi:hypothetical protein